MLKWARPQWRAGLLLWRNAWCETATVYSTDRHYLSVLPCEDGGMKTEKKKSTYDADMAAARTAFITDNPAMANYNRALIAYKAAATKAKIARDAAQKAKIEEDLAIEEVGLAALEACYLDAISDQNICAIAKAQTGANDAKKAHDVADDARLQALADAVDAEQSGAPVNPDNVANATSAEKTAFEAHQASLVAVQCAVKAASSAV